jgi:FtsZ-interacting cell division protein ZipA
MSTALAIVIVIAIIAIAAALWMFIEKRRTHRLQTQFGSEYDRMVEASGRKQAETELEHRAKRVHKFQIRKLGNEEQARFADSWRREQAQFVDDPRSAVENADRLVGEVMKARGYPLGEFETRAADLSVDHPRVIDNYRVAHEIALRDSRGEASTEDLRKAMVCYRALFEDLLEEHVVEHEEVRR